MMTEAMQLDLVNGNLGLDTLQWKLKINHRENHVCWKGLLEEKEVEVAFETTENQGK